MSKTTNAYISIYYFYTGIKKSKQKIENLFYLLIYSMQNITICQYPPPDFDVFLRQKAYQEKY